MEVGGLWKGIKELFQLCVNIQDQADSLDDFLECLKYT